MKKLGDEMLTTGIEEMVAMNNTAVETKPPIERTILPLRQPQLHAKVNSMIHEHLTDMWLLVTGEEMKTDTSAGKRLEGRPFAFICDGQMRLLESRPFTLDVLRNLGIEMS